MFVIGMELDVKVLKNKASEAIVISHASIIIPFSMGIGLSYFVYNQFAPKEEFLSFSLLWVLLWYYCISCSCLLLQGRGIHKTRLEQLLLHVPLLTILRLGAYLQLLLQ
jgi:Kef-type K+ transport system membrane component KefB